MVISCDSCGARFRFDGSLFGGAGGARIRCRRCGGMIDVRNPTAVDRKQTVESPPAESRPEPPPLPSASAQTPGNPATRDIPFLRVGGLTGGKEQARDRRGTSLILYTVLIIGTLLLGSAGLGYLGSSTGGRKPDKAVGSDPGTQGMFTGSGKRFEFDNLETYYHRNRESGGIFVLKGRVTLAGGAGGKGRIRVNASVLNPDKGCIAAKTVYAGNLVPDEDLLHRDRAYIEQALSGNGGGATAKDGASPLSSLPFMVVFFDVPNNIADFHLAAEQLAD